MNLINESDDNELNSNSYLNSNLNLKLNEKEDEFNYSSTFHLKDEYDVLGKSYLEVPISLKQMHSSTNYIPKKLVHTFEGHKDKVLKVEFFPKFGHYFLSCSSDKTVKLWDVMNSKKCVRTYTGFNHEVKDISFSNNGRNFSSISLDKKLVYWDTETGTALNIYNCDKFMLCCKINPDVNVNNDILVGTSNKSVSMFKFRYINMI